MNKLAICLNIALLLCVVWLVSDKGLPKQGDDIVIFLLLITVSVVNLITIWYGLNDEEIKLRKQVRKAELLKKLKELEK